MNDEEQRLRYESWLADCGVELMHPDDEKPSLTSITRETKVYGGATTKVHQMFPAIQKPSPVKDGSMRRANLGLPGLRELGITMDTANNTIYFFEPEMCI
eukprot:gene27819-34599_t